MIDKNNKIMWLYLFLLICSIAETSKSQEGDRLSQALIAEIEKCSTFKGFKILFMIDKVGCSACIAKSIRIDEEMERKHPELEKIYALRVDRMKEIDGSWGKLITKVKHFIPTLSSFPDWNMRNINGAILLLDKHNNILLRSSVFDDNPIYKLDTAYSGCLSRKKYSVERTDTIILKEQSLINTPRCSNINSRGELLVIDQATSSISLFVMPSGRREATIEIRKSHLEHLLNKNEIIIAPPFEESPDGIRLRFVDFSEIDSIAIICGTFPYADTSSDKRNLSISAKPFICWYNYISGIVKDAKRFYDIRPELDNIRNMNFVKYVPGLLIVGEQIRNTSNVRHMKYKVLHQINMHTFDMRSDYDQELAQERGNLLGNYLNVYCAITKKDIYAIQTLEDSLYSVMNNKKYPINIQGYIPPLSGIELFDYSSNITDEEWRRKLGQIITLKSYFVNLVYIGKECLGLRYRTSTRDNTYKEHVIIYDTETDCAAAVIDDHAGGMVSDDQSNGFAYVFKENDQMKVIRCVLSK